MGTPHERKGTQIINLSPLLIYELYNKPYKSKTKKKKHSKDMERGTPNMVR
jgi:hypothetical protein